MLLGVLLLFIGVRYINPFGIPNTRVKASA